MFSSYIKQLNDRIKLNNRNKKLNKKENVTKSHPQMLLVKQQLLILMLWLEFITLEVVAWPSQTKARVSHWSNWDKLVIFLRLVDLVLHVKHWHQATLLLLWSPVIFFFNGPWHQCCQGSLACMFLRWNINIASPDSALSVTSLLLL